MTVRKLTVAPHTAGTGAVTAYSPYISGRLASIQYVKDGSNNYTDGVGFTITAEATGETLWTEAAVNASAVRYPRAGTHTTAGVASLYAAGGTAVTDTIRLARDRVKIVLASGGSGKDGVFNIIVEDA